MKAHNDQCRCESDAKRTALPNGNVCLTEAEWAEWRALNRKPGVTMAEIRAFIEGHGYEWLEGGFTSPSKSSPEQPDHSTDRAA